MLNSLVYLISKVAFKIRNTIFKFLFQMKQLGSTWLQQQSPLLALWLHCNVPES